jgi:hypothetical protein
MVKKGIHTAVPMLLALILAVLGLRDGRALDPLAIDRVELRITIGMSSCTGWDG